ncbi:glycosyltransferase, partial [Vibrio sp. 2033]
VEVANDYSDLIEKMEYYIAHPDEAENIINNAHAWVDQFRNQKRERLISLLVAKKYFEKSGQM